VKLDPRLSAKLKALSALGIAAVIVGHAPSFRDPAAPSLRSVPYAVVEFLCVDSFIRPVVMMFLAISGWLMFLEHDGTPQTHVRKVAARMRSLLFPYLLWSALAIGVYWVLQRAPWTAGWFTNPARRVVDRPIRDLLLLWLFDPIAYQLWFLRDLIVLVWLSPLLLALLRAAGPLALLPLAVTSFLGIVLPGPVPGVPLLTSDSYFWYAVGAWFAVKRLPLSDGRRLAVPLGLVMLLLALVRSWGHVTGVLPHAWVQKAVYVVGVPALWIGYDRWLRGLERPSLQFLTGQAFFVFLAHEPLMTMLRKPLVRWCGAGDLAHLVELLATLGGTLAIVLPLGVLLRARWPRLYAFLCGGRG